MVELNDKPVTREVTRRDASTWRTGWAGGYASWPMSNAGRVVIRQSLTGRRRTPRSLRGPRPRLHRQARPMMIKNAAWRAVWDMNWDFLEVGYAPS